MKKLLTVAGVAALLAGCYSTRNEYPPASGSSASDEYVYRGYYESPRYRGYYDTLGPPMASNLWARPVGSGVEAAMPPGTASGGTLRQTY